MTPDSDLPESIPPSVPAPAPSTPPRSVFRSIFVGPSGIRAGWRFLIFVALFQAMTFAQQFLLAQIPAVARAGQEAQHGTITPLFGIVNELAQTALAFLAAVIMTHVEKRPFSAYGIPRQGAFGQIFWLGVVWGLALVSLEMLSMSAFGGFAFGGLALDAAGILKYGIAWALVFLLVGISEEFLFRGYALFTLSTGMGFWPAAILLSALFGGVHLTNSGEDWVGALSVVVFALFACLALRRTGNLWFAIGFHAAGDFAESFIYSVPDSGLMTRGHLLNSSLHGPHWLTGGAVGPEGTVFDFVFILLSAIVFARLFPSAARSGLIATPTETRAPTQ
jgi:uncharacterized protein